MRDPARIMPTMLSIAYAWMAVPDQRLGQFLVNAVGEDALWAVEDDEIVTKVERHIKDFPPKLDR